MRRTAHEGPVLLRRAGLALLFKLRVDDIIVIILGRRSVLARGETFIALSLLIDSPEDLSRLLLEELHLRLNPLNVIPLEGLLEGSDRLLELLLIFLGELIFQLLDAPLRLMDERLRLVPELDHPLLLSIFFSVRLRVADHALDLVIAETA